MRSRLLLGGDILRRQELPFEAIGGRGLRVLPQLDVDASHPGDRASRDHLREDDQANVRCLVPRPDEAERSLAVRRRDAELGHVAHHIGTKDEQQAILDEEERHL